MRRSYLLRTDFCELATDFDFLIPKMPEYLVGSTIPVVAETIANRTAGGAQLST